MASSLVVLAALLTLFSFVIAASCYRHGDRIRRVSHYMFFVSGFSFAAFLMRWVRPWFSRLCGPHWDKRDAELQELVSAESSPHSGFVFTDGLMPGVHSHHWSTEHTLVGSPQPGGPYSCTNLHLGAAHALSSRLLGPQMRAPRAFCKWC